MLEEDVEHHRLALDGDALSILRFGRFVRMVKSGEVMRRLEFIPLDHLEFYKETLVRLVNATELPASVMEQFEYAFPLNVVTAIGRGAPRNRQGWALTLVD
jgi:hypothetical protein